MLQSVQSQSTFLLSQILYVVQKEKAVLRSWKWRLYFNAEIRLGKPESKSGRWNVVNVSKAHFYFCRKRTFHLFTSITLGLLILMSDTNAVPFKISIVSHNCWRSCIIYTYMYFYTPCIGMCMRIYYVQMCIHYVHIFLYTMYTFI